MHRIIGFKAALRHPLVQSLHQSSSASKTLYVAFACTFSAIGSSLPCSCQLPDIPTREKILLPFEPIDIGLAWTSILSPQSWVCPLTQCSVSLIFAYQFFVIKSRTQQFDFLCLNPGFATSTFCNLRP